MSVPAFSVPVWAVLIFVTAIVWFFTLRYKPSGSYDFTGAFVGIGALAVTVSIWGTWLLMQITRWLS